eukprot:SAG11_NODE_5338_length_1590_cov_1.492958_2_plen_100_part_00
MSVLNGSVRPDCTARAAAPSKGYLSRRWARTTPHVAERRVVQLLQLLAIGALEFLLASCNADGSRMAVQRVRAVRHSPWNTEESHRSVQRVRAVRHSPC